MSGIKRPLLALAAVIGLVLVLPLAPALGENLRRIHPASSSPVRAQYLVLFVLDGGRPDYIGLTHLPHVDALRAHGVQFTNTIDGILESETPAGHTTLATGSTPRRDGILGFNWAQNDNDYSLFSPTVIRSGALEHIVEQRGVPTIAGLYKAHFRSNKVVALSGHKYYAADPLGGPRADAILYYTLDGKHHYVPAAIPGHMPPASLLQKHNLIAPEHLHFGEDDSYAAKLAMATFQVMRPHVTLINVPEFDWPLGHVYGGNLDRKDTIALMKRFDSDLGKIEDQYRKAGILDKTLFVITSDHGMAPVTHFIPYTTIQNAITKAGTKPTSIAYNHSAYIWLHDPRKAAAVAHNLAAAHDPGVNSVYYLTGTGRNHGYRRAAGTTVTAASEAANQYLLRTLMNGHEPTVVLFCRTDATTSSNSTNWRADHGGPTWQSEHIPLILSGPGIRRGVVLRQPAQLDDVAPTVLTDLGVTPHGMEGRVLTDALTNPAGVSTHARSAEIKQLQPIVQALVTRDAYERAHVPYGHR